ncbi:MAG TPA: DUF5919 domain-containing protein [Micromonosporaceae bacterium]|nr:DUF5919 domain-containing protein [Micromonosporaceae bacterium]
MTKQPVRLKALLQSRHWQTFGTFCREYDKAAMRVDKQLVGTAPSRPQFHRWLSGTLTRLPHSHHCQVLEEMLPGWTAHELFAPYEEEHEPRPSANPQRPVDNTLTGYEQFSDVTEVYASRSEFAARMPPEKLLDGASMIRASGLSLNLLCQHYSDKQWQSLIHGGTQLQVLFLDPNGQGMRAREAEEGFDEGYLSGLTILNIRTLLRIRDRLPEELKDRVEIGTYDETIRFNIVLIDDRVCVTQPYLPSTRGIDSPTLLIERRWPAAGLYPTFESVFNSLWERRQSL